MILILTEKNDAHANALVKTLKQDTKDVFRLNLDTKSLEKTEIFFNGSDWEIFQNKKKLKSTEVTCVWNRRTFVQLMLDEQDRDYEFNIWKNEWNKTLLGFYYSIKDKSWINYYRDNHKAENKYYQLDLAKKLGFNTPSFLLSNDKDKLKTFVNNQRVVMKLMNQDFYKVGEKEFRGFYVNIINKDHLEEFGNNEENPIFLQNYIEKKYEVRYTVVGDEHFVCKIDSQKSSIAKIDWRRYDISNTPHSQMPPPKEIKVKIKKFMKEMNLVYGAFDFIVDLNDEWFFLEINPSGQYLWIEDLTGMKISDSIKNKLLYLHNYTKNKII